MANPAITGSIGIKSYSASTIISTATTDECLIGNIASSGKLVRIHSLVIHNIDGTNAATFQLKRRDQDGVPMHSNVGTYQAAIGGDTVAGTDVGGYHNISVAAGNSLVVIDTNMNVTLQEDESYVIQASAANDLAVEVNYSVIG
jgi:hypothetical protein